MEFSGATTAIIFGSPSCGPCRRLLESMVDFAADERSRGDVRLLFLSTGDVAATRTIVPNRPPENLEFICVAESAMEDFKVRVTPFSFLVDQNSVVVRKGLANHVADLYELVRANRPIDRRIAWIFV